MRVRCLDEEMTDYATGRLPLERQWAWDRHLVACRVCAHAVDQERRLRSALAGAPSMPGDLRSSLIALGTALAADAGPRVPAPTDPLRLLAPSAPPCHRSALRATVVAAAAAGVSAAAAWSLTVVPAPGTGIPALATTTAPAVSPAPSAAPTRTSGAVGSSVSPVELTQTVVLTRLTQRAESTP